MVKVLIGERAFGELVIGLDEIFAEAFGAVAVDFGVDGFDRIEYVADLGTGEVLVVEEVGELFEGLLEEDVVLPEGVVGVDDEVLAGHAPGRSRP